MTRIEDIEKLLDSIDLAFQKENTELIDKRNKLTNQLGEFREEIDELNLVLERKLSATSFSKAIKVLDMKEIEMLISISKSRTKKEVYRKSFRNADPYDSVAWDRINLLESLHLIKVHRNELDSSIRLFECLVPSDLLIETFKLNTSE